MSRGSSLSPLEWCTVVVPPENGVGAEEGEVHDASAEGLLMNVLVGRVLYDLSTWHDRRVGKYE